MTRYVLRQVMSGLAVLLATSVIVFGLLHLAPGDPASILAGPDAAEDTIAAIRTEMGLDQHPVAQYLDWLRQLLTGDLGMSYTLGQPVSELIGQRIGSTLQLTVTATFLMILLGTAMGVGLATSKSRVIKQGIDSMATLALAMPPFVSGVLLIFLFAVVWGVLPSGGEASLLGEPADAVSRLILPSIAMALPTAPVLGRLLATEMRRTRDQEFVLTAQAKGASTRWITWRHVVPNSLGPAIVELGIRVGHLLGGVVVAEAIFARAGLGSLLVEAVQTRDYRLAQVLLLLGIAVMIAAQLATEVCMARLDPRIRLGVSS
ncbi:ABC transporter permease [Actinobacteria bacterium YIM 96077]|uniref:ABC transporter permease n=1 Tax=Phytoactinopolyspora halophila TaxID=1981511 RepID=A0A329QC62_9ACTN|nr:ABC transporter permease [Phytoactinopolyspora halophila]AYY11816.1 ABC transporter permease [Actinobacteria bacterium YIM 96077]RAW09837.1 ABC transporter permease [Phytoactinopolyspora halophila]